MIKNDKHHIKEKDENTARSGEGEKNNNTSPAVESQTENADGNNVKKPPVNNLEEELEKKNKEVESLTDLLKRRQADFENYKKRMLRDQDDQRKLAIKDFAFDIININDDLLRAIDAASNIRDDQTKSFVDGARIISKRIIEALQKYGITEIDSLNKEFDPRFNEAVEIKMSDEVDSDTITEVYQKGFKLDDFVIRCARVRVTKPYPSKENGGSDGSTDEENYCAEEEKKVNTN